MVNISIVSLCLNSQELSPIFTSASISAKGITVFRSFSPLFFSVSRTSCSRSAFLNFLSPVYVNSWNNTVTTRQSITSSPASFSHCLFLNIHSSSNGGAIYCSFSSYSLFSLTNCIFQNCSSSVEGGAIYSNYVNFTIKFTCFYRCYALTSTNNYGGSAFTINYGNQTINEITLFQNAPSFSLSCDSLLFIRYSTLNLIYENATSGIGSNNGGAGGSYWSLTTTSTLQFSTVYNSSDHNSIEDFTYPMTIYKWNIIGNTVAASPIWAELTTFTIDSCVLYGNSLKALSSNGGSYIFTNCIGDLSGYSITTTASANWVSISAVKLSVCQGSTNLFSDNFPSLDLQIAGLIFMANFCNLITQ